MEGLVPLALAKLRDIMLLPLPPAGDFELDEMVKVAKLHLTAADTTLKIQTRVDENRLRKRSTDIIPQILEVLKEERRRLALPVE